MAGIRRAATFASSASVAITAWLHAALKTPDSRVTRRLQQSFHPVRAKVDTNNPHKAPGRQRIIFVHSQVMKSLTKQAWLKTSKARSNKTTLLFHPPKTVHQGRLKEAGIFLG